MKLNLLFYSLDPVWIPVCWLVGWQWESCPERTTGRHSGWERDISIPQLAVLRSPSCLYLPLEALEWIII